MHPASPIPHPVVIDTDPGIDDMLALLLALASPELDVRGISVSYGNTVVENAYRNAVEILRRAGRRVTLGVGARRRCGASWWWRAKRTGRPVSATRRSRPQE